MRAGLTDHGLWRGASSARGLSAVACAPAAARLRGVELSPIKEIELRASRLPDVVSLAQGIPSFDTPQPIKAFAERMLRDGMCAKYSVTPGLPRLREVVAEALWNDGMRYDPDGEIIVTVGSIEAIASTLLATVDPGDEVLVVSPTYASYVPAIQIAGGTPRFVPLNEDANFDLDPDAIASAVGRRTRALLICNPNNPTGTVFSREQTRRMLEVAERHDLLVITDEVYKDIIYGDARIYSAAMEPAARGRVIRVCSFSKTYGMTGWRVGFLHGPASRVSQILKVHDALVTCAPVVSQYAAMAALTDGAAAVEVFREELRARRARIIERLDAMPHVFDYQKPEASYFVFPRVKDTVPYARDSRALANQLLDEARVAVVPGIAFGPSGEAHLRFCYARSTQDIDRAFDRLEGFFAGGAAPRASGARPPARMAPGVPAVRPARDAGVWLLRRLARSYLRRHRPRVVAITGVQGKTVLKRTLHELLARRFRVRANPLSYNTAIGLPLAILGCELDIGGSMAAGRGLFQALRAAALAPPVDVLVLELGVRSPGDMGAHLDLVEPRVAVVTNLMPRFSDDHNALAVLRREVGVLCAHSRQRGLRGLLLCGDDPALCELASQTPGSILFGNEDIEVEGNQLSLIVDGERLPVGRESVGASSRYALLAAVRVARLLGVEEEEIRRFLEG